MDESSEKRYLLQALLVGCVLFVACSLGTLNDMSAQTVATRETSIEPQESATPAYANLGLIATDPEASRIWTQFTKGGRYRLARREDFSFSDDHYRPYVDGDFKGDHVYNNFAAIVVDTMRNDSRRFGIVIFNSIDGKGYAGPFWLYRMMDLSRTSLNTSSHGPLLIAEHRENGSIRACIARWNPSRKQYRCHHVR
jgi:hypothetical protein